MRPRPAARRLRSGAVRTVLIVLVIIVAVPGGLWFAHTQNEKRRAHARAVAAAAGLNIDLDTKDPPPTPFDLTNKGRARRVTYHMWATGSGDSVFQYRYTTGSGKNSRTWRYTCALVALPFNAPHLTIGPEGFWSNLGQMIGIRDVEIESPEFNERYRVSCDDERFAVTLLDHQMIGWMLSDASGGGTVRFELLGNSLLCINEPLAVEHMPGMLVWASAIREHFPVILSELYPSRSVGG